MRYMMPHVPSSCVPALMVSDAKALASSTFLSEKWVSFILFVKYHQNNYNNNDDDNDDDDGGGSDE